MALFSIRNERDLIVLGALAAETTAATFATDADAGEGKVYNQYGAAITGKEKFSVYVKHLDGRVRKSDVIDPDKVESFKKQVPVSPVLPKSVITVTTATAGDLYEVRIKIFNDGALSNEDCVLIEGSYEAKTGDDVTAVAVGIVAAFKAAQTRMGQTYFTVSNTAGAITFQSINLPFQTGKQDGRQLDYNIKAIQVNPSTLVYGSMTVVNTAGVLDPTSINYLKDLEWQTRGAFGDSYRGLMYPFDFALQSDIVASVTYTLYEFQFWGGDRNDHAVQKSPRHLTVAVPAAGVSAFDAIIAKALAKVDLTTAATDGQVIGWTDAVGTYHPIANS